MKFYLPVARARLPASRFYNNCMKDILLYIRFAQRYARENATLRHIKQFRRWYNDKRSGDTTLSRELPWMTYDAIDFLSSIAAPDHEVFEWGSGGSTLFFARRCDRVISVEHDKKWNNFLKEKLLDLSINNVEYLEIPGVEVNDWEERDYRNPDDFISSDKNSIGLSYENYVKAIDAFPVNHFNIVVVDGRARNCCVKRAIPHVKKGGYLIVDNSDRKYYLQDFDELQDPGKWEKTEFQGPVFFQHAFSKTSFFRKI